MSGTVHWLFDNSAAAKACRAYAGLLCFFVVLFVLAVLLPRVRGGVISHISGDDVERGVLQWVLLLSAVSGLATLVLAAVPYGYKRRRNPADTIWLTLTFYVTIGLAILQGLIFFCVFGGPQLFGGSLTIDAIEWIFVAAGLASVVLISSIDILWWAHARETGGGTGRELSTLLELDLPILAGVVATSILHFSVLRADFAAERLVYLYAFSCGAVAMQMVIGNMSFGITLLRSALADYRRGATP